jgi:hypothetical protein
MEVVKIVGGLAVIAVIVVAVGLDRRAGAEEAAAPVAVERGFSSSSSSARFVSVAPKD